MAKLLNLDEVVNPLKQVLINTKTHNVIERSVRQIITGKETMERLEKSIDMVEQVELMVGLIKVAIPTLKEDEILDLPTLTMFKLAEFITSSEDTGEKDEEGKQ